MSNQFDKYRTHIAELSEEDQKLREKYLMKLARGEIQGPKTGFPSLDKPQLADYDEEAYFAEQPKQTITEALINNNKKNMWRTAIEYFGNKISYRKLIKRTNDLTKALCNYGIGKGDYVSVCLPGIPEGMTSLYSFGHLGAVGIFLPPYLDIEGMISDIKFKNSKTLIIMDKFYDENKEKFDRVIEETGLEHIIVVPTLNSSIMGKFLEFEKYDDPRFELYNDFIKKGKKTPLPERVKYEEDMPLAVVYSSGTTGLLKGVILSHDSFINSANSYKAIGFNLKPGQNVYQAIPLWSSTGLIADGATANYYGCGLHQDPRFEPGTYTKNLGKFRLNWGVATTDMFLGIKENLKNSKFRMQVALGILNYRKLEQVYIGGTFSTPKDAKEIDEALEAVHCPAKKKNSWGRCENGSIVTAEINGHDYPDYSIGIPIPGAIVMSVDEQGHELPFGQRGELAVHTTCGMLGYYNRPNIDPGMFKEEFSGIEYNFTGDIGYVLPSGVVIYEGRKNDTSVINGETLYNFDVKKAILEDPDVRDCEVFAKEDNGENTLCAQVKFYSNNVASTEKLQELQRRVLYTFWNFNYIPETMKVRDSFPMASSTKRDYKALKAETDGYVRLEKKLLNIYQTK